MARLIWPSVSTGRVLLLHNEKNGTFKDVTRRPESRGPMVFNLGLTFIDYDHDGDLDLYRYPIQSHGLTSIREARVVERDGVSGALRLESNLAEQWQRDLYRRH